MSRKLLPPVHPGHILKEDFMDPLGLSARALALKLGVPANRISAIIAGSRAVTADTALRLARHFGTSADLWIGLQGDYDLETARRRSHERIEREVEPRSAA